MTGLNFHHLLYFFAVAREGGLGPASALLRLSPSALSGQIKKLEDQLGQRLFEKQGRRLTMTETGRIVFEYAEEIFGLGNELVDTVRSRSRGRTQRLKVGISNQISKALVRRLLSAALADEDVVLTCNEDKIDRLLFDLSNHQLDVVINETPVPPASPIRAFNHLLGHSTLTLLAPREQAASLREGFPRSLDGANVVLPLHGSALRRDLDTWFVHHDVRPRLRAEAEGSALLKTFAAEGMGAVFVPTVISRMVATQFGLAMVCEVPSLHERYYAISAERKLIHPAVLAIRNAARKDVF